jgi:hypothetical protein
MFGAVVQKCFRENVATVMAQAAQASGPCGPVVQGLGAGAVHPSAPDLVSGRPDAADRASHQGGRACRLPPVPPRIAVRVVSVQAKLRRANWRLAGLDETHHVQGPDVDRDAEQRTAGAAGGPPTEIPQLLLSGANEHRLKPLWTTSARASPGESLGGLRVASGPATYDVHCTDEHAQERQLAGAWPASPRRASRGGRPQLLVSAFLQAGERRHGFFTIRRHCALTIELRSRGCGCGCLKHRGCPRANRATAGPAGQRGTLRRTQGP